MEGEWVRVVVIVIVSLLWKIGESLCRDCDCVVVVIVVVEDR